MDAERRRLSDLETALGVGIGFGLQEIVGSFVSGLILLFERPIKVDDWVEVEGVMGVVKHISIRATEVRTFDNVSLLVPNRAFISGNVTNYTHEDAKIRDRITVGVAYGSDTENVKQTLLEVARKNPAVLRWPAPDCRFLGFGESSLDMALVYWVYIENRATTHSALNFAVDAAFREQGIEVPFPQRDVHMIPPPRDPDEPTEPATEPDAPAQATDPSASPSGPPPAPSA